MLSEVPASPRPSAPSRTVFAMMLREMVTTYGRSPGGYLWAILEPVAAIALLSFAFSMAFRAPSLGTSFPLFYATGYLPYMLFHDISNKTATAIRFSKPLLSFGAVTHIDALLARFTLNLLTHLTIFIIVISGLLVVSDARAVLDGPVILTALAMVAALGFGVGVMNCYLFGVFPAWERVWMVVTRPLFIVSGVFFLFEDVPGDFQPLLWLNPLFHATGEMRIGFYPGYDAAYVTPVYSFALALGLTLFGLILLARVHDDLVHG